jgi:hypothetical protein
VIFSGYAYPLDQTKKGAKPLRVLTRNSDAPHPARDHPHRVTRYESLARIHLPHRAQYGIIRDLTTVRPRSQIGYQVRMAQYAMADASSRIIGVQRKGEHEI